MSSPSRVLTISDAAERDIEEILLYTETMWGSDQVVAYRRRLLSLLEELLTYPRLGPLPDDLFLGCRVLRVDKHKAFYRVADKVILVVRILHERRETAGQFRERQP